MNLQHQLPSAPLARLLLSIRRRIAKRRGHFTNTPSSYETDHSSIESCVSLLKKWLEQCDIHHDDRCKITPIAERPSWQIPDWVIDAKEGCIVPGHSVQRYAALSYVWDLPSQQSSQGTSERLMLRNDNIDAFQKPGFLSAGGRTELPVAVRDSLDLILQTGIRYLWVDCLCIVQHAETTRSRVEAMKEIYSGACVTVVAATTRGELFAPRTCSADGEEAGGALLQQTRHESKMNKRSLYDSLLATHWASRGWTFQEQLLSKRSINFLEDTIFWDCECSVWWPSSKGIAGDDKEKPGPKRIKNSPTERYFASRYPHLLSSDFNQSDCDETVQQYTMLSRALETPSIPNFRLYWELICRYNHRSLTYPQDALAAFSGVLRLATQGSLNGFVCGLPVLFLDAALTWQPLRKAKRRVATDTGRSIAPAAPLPSWSWVGWQCLIDPESMISGLDYEVDQVVEGKLVLPESSWKITKLVDWYALSDKDQSPGTLLKEHQLMNSYKEFQNNPYANDLPEGWSRKPVSEFVSARAVANWKNVSFVTRQRIPKPESRPVQCFSNDIQEDTLYYYPFPSINSASVATSNVSNAAFLSCTTTVAEFKVRRILIYGYTERKPGFALSISSVAYPITETSIYKDMKTAEEDKTATIKFNSIITLEDGDGRWAGLLRVMDDDTAIKSGNMIQLIAISKGRADRREVSRTYEASIDSHSRWRDSRGDHLVFTSVNSQQTSVKTTASDSSPDLEPLSPPKDIAYDLEDEWEDETYPFYNVLWVETKDGVMYRKAAGRISEDIWGKMCGAPQRIVLG